MPGLIDQRFVELFRTALHLTLNMSTRGKHMRILTYISMILFSCALLYTPATYADDAVATMANIVISFKHFPSDSDKSALATIGESDSSDAVKTVANAIANISHKVTAADKDKLDALIGDDDNPEGLRTLAGIVGSLNHMPGADAIASLESLTQ